MKQNRIFLFFCMIIVENAAFAQFSAPKSSSYSIYKMPFANGRTFTQGQIFNVPGNFYALQLGFFCKKEWKFESVTGLPLKFRLGTVRYCDWLEGKRSAGLSPGN